MGGEQLAQLRNRLLEKLRHILFEEVQPRGRARIAFERGSIKAAIVSRIIEVGLGPLDDEIGSAKPGRMLDEALRRVAGPNEVAKPPQSGVVEGQAGEFEIHEIVANLS